MNQNDRIYQRVLSCIDKQTDNKHQGQTIPRHTVKSILCASGTLDPDAFDRALEAAVENGDVVRDGDRLALAKS